MRSFVVTITMGLLVALAGCNQGTSGGPGASNPAFEESLVGQADDTFSLDIPSTTLAQGEVKTLLVAINRGKNFGEEVSLEFAELPDGLTVSPRIPRIKQSDSDTELTLSAADGAALGDFTVSVTGQPTKGAVAVTDAKITITKQEPTDAEVAADAVQETWNRYTIAMQEQWAQYKVKYEELKERAARAEGQAKIDLDAKVAEAKVKFDAASARIDEMNSASSDRWDKVKEGVANAFDDLKGIFE